MKFFLFFQYYKYNYCMSKTRQRQEVEGRANNKESKKLIIITINTTIIMMKIKRCTCFADVLLKYFHVFDFCC